MFKQARFFLISVLMVGLTASFACATPNRSMMDSGKDFVTPHSLADKNIVGVQGYDLVSYHTNEKPLRGNGNHVVEHDGITYLFINKKNQETFAANPHKYLPAFGGYCAYGVAVGKKFVGDPDVWKVVDDKLYLNLDNRIQGVWNKDIRGNIQKAEKNWGQIKDKNASEL